MVAGRLSYAYIFRIFAGLALILITLTLAGCRKERVQGYYNKKIVIGYSIHGLDTERWIREKAMAEKYAKDHGIVLLIKDAQKNPETQIKQCENLIYQGIDVLIVLPEDVESAGKIAELGKKNGVPVIAYDRLISGPVDYYVSFDQGKVGRLQANELIKKYPKGNYIFLKGSPTDFNTHLYAKGSREILSPYINRGSINIVSEFYCNAWYDTEAYKHVIEVLKKNRNISAVLAPNDDTARAVIQALKEYGLAGKVGVSGQDAELASIKAILAGEQIMTVYKQIQRMNDEAFKLAIDVATGKRPYTNGYVDNGHHKVPTLFLDVVLVTKENINQTVINDGFYSASQVYN